MDSAQVVGAIIHRDRFAIATEVTAIARAGTPDGDESIFESTLRDISKLFLAVVSGRPAIFARWMEWHRSVSVSRDVPLSTVRRQAQILRDVVVASLTPEEIAIVEPVFAAGLAALDTVLQPDSPAIDPGAPHAAAASHYLELILAGRAQEAIAGVERMVVEGLPVTDAYRRIIEPAQREVGRLWQLNRVSVAQEHIVTDASRTLMGLLRARFAPARRRDVGVVVSCLGGELHDLGARMVSDFLHLAGFRTSFTGANTPHGAIADEVRRSDATVVALSATVMLQVRLAFELIDALRDTFGERVRILVGGYAFNRHAGLWRDVGADAFAESPEAAVETVERFEGSTRRVVTAPR